MWILLISLFTVVQFNCENLYDCAHDSLKDDYEYLPGGKRVWSPYKYSRKISAVAKAVLACCDDSAGQAIPDIVALCEIENDSVMERLTRRSPLRNLRYGYVATASADQRGIDVAIMYHSYTFTPLRHYAVRVAPPPGMRPTRDILYLCGTDVSGDTLHILAVHAPSKYGGARRTAPYREAVSRRIAAIVDSVRLRHREARIVVTGDFNAYNGDASLRVLEDAGLEDVSAEARGANGAKGTYKYKGRWGSLDHIYATRPLARQLLRCHVVDVPPLTEPDPKYGGIRPHRTYIGYRYSSGGTSDHLPLVARFSRLSTVNKE